MFLGCLLKVDACADQERSTGGGGLENHKATKPAFNVGPSSARQRNGISMYLDPLSPHQLNKGKNKTSYLDRTTWQNFLDPRMRWLYYCRNFAFDSTFGQNGSEYLLILGFVR